MRVALVFGLSFFVMGATAKAAVCPSAAQPESCHYTYPGEAEASGAPASPVQNYTPVVWYQGLYSIDPEESELQEYIYRPGFDVESGAGVYGTGSAEPMAIVRNNFAYRADSPKEYFSAEDAWQFECEPESSLCQQSSVTGAWRVNPQSTAEVRRAYRIIKTNPAALPSSIDTVPVKVDYKIHATLGGVREGLEEFLPAHYASARVQFGNYGRSGGAWRFNGQGVGYYTDSTTTCTAIQGGAQLPVSGRTCSGTFTSNVNVDLLDTLGLQLFAQLMVPAPVCRDRAINGSTFCLGAPFIGVSHLVADPYVYIDPDWEYASWFELEMSADETDTTWVTPERTAFDPETLTLGEGTVTPPGDDGDGGGNGTPDGGAGGSTDGDGTAKEDGSSGGCQAGSYGGLASWMGLAFVLAGVSYRRRASRAL